MARGVHCLQQAQGLQPDTPGPKEALYRYLSLLGRPQDTLYCCDRAVEADPTGLSRDSRALAYSLLGRTAQAISDFELFLAWLDTQTEKAKVRYQDRRARVKDLRSGACPFSEEVLRGLRFE